MLLYGFASQKKARTALTNDPTGANLPEDLEPWVPAGQRNIEPDDQRVEGDGNAILASIAEQGYFMPKP